MSWMSLTKFFRVRMATPALLFLYEAISINWSSIVVYWPFCLVSVREKVSLPKLLISSIISYCFSDKLRTFRKSLYLFFALYVAILISEAPYWNFQQIIRSFRSDGVLIPRWNSEPQGTMYFSSVWFFNFGLSGKGSSITIARNIVLNILRTHKSCTRQTSLISWGFFIIILIIITSDL